MTFRESRRVIAWFKFANSLIFTQHCFRSISSNYETTFNYVFAMTCNHLYLMSTWNKIKTCYQSIYKKSRQIAQKSSRINLSKIRINECHSKFQTFEFIFDLNEFIFELKMQNKIFICVIDFDYIYTITKFVNMKSHCSIYHFDHKKRFSIKKILSSWIFVSRCQQMFLFDHDNNYFRLNFILSTINETNDDMMFVNVIDKIKQLFHVIRDVLNFRVFYRIKIVKKKSNLHHEWKK